MSKEKELLKKIKEGEPSGVDELIAEYYRQIFRYCLWHTADRQTAEDAAQEVFLRLVRHLEAVRRSSRLRPYLYKIAANVCADLYRAKKAEELPEDLVYIERDFEAVEDEWDFQQMIRTLPPEQRDVLILRFSQDLTLRETAKILEIPLRTAQSRLRSALKKLEKQYQKGNRR